MKRISTFLFGISLLVPGVAVSDTEVFFDDFELGAASEWSTARTDITPVGARSFLGRFAAETVKLNLESLPSHTSVRVSFSLFVIQSWDGNNTSNGPDTFNLSVAGGPDLINTTFSNTDRCSSNVQAYPDNFPGGANPGWTGASEVNTLGYP